MSSHRIASHRITSHHTLTTLVSASASREPTESRCVLMLLPPPPSAAPPRRWSWSTSGKGCALFRHEAKIDSLSLRGAEWRVAWAGGQGEGERAQKKANTSTTPVKAMCTRKTLNLLKVWVPVLLLQGTAIVAVRGPQALV